ncbi:MAG: hypothetical protein AAGA03_15585 [Planctomycetota bacterium]
MVKSKPALLLAAALLGASYLPGCSRNEPVRATAAGSVTADGKAISGVVIRLKPIAPTKGPKAAVAVINGDFSIGPEFSLHGGLYGVSFTVLPPELLAQLPEDAKTTAVEKGQFVTNEFDVGSQVTWTLNAGEENRRDFEITLQ